MMAAAGISPGLSRNPARSPVGRMNPQQNAHVSLLLQQNRYADAEAALRNVLAQEPDNFEALLLSGVALHCQDMEEDALGAMNVALRIEPESDRAHAWKSRILTSLHRLPDAVRSAGQALELDAQDPFNWSTMAMIHIHRREWAEAERCARTALELDPDDQTAHHLLSQSLMIQGRGQENEGNIAARLAEDPENEIAHCNAGYAALRRGDHRKAAEHFAAALRIDAECEMARDGLIESFRARSFIYRTYLGFSYRMAALSQKYGAGLMLGIFFVYKFTRQLLETVDPRLATGLMVLYLMFFFWTYVAKGLSTFFLLADRFARLALRPKEKLEALLVGGGFAIGLLLLGTAFVFNHGALLLTGGAFMVQSVPASLFFERESKAGRLVYGGFSAVVWVCALIVIAWAWIPGFPDGIGTAALTTGLITASVCTFAALFGLARR